MRISNKKIIGLKVETQSGESIGQIRDFKIQIDSQSVIEYSIKPASFLKSLAIGELIINRGQVIDITEEKMVVDDGAIDSGLKKKIKDLEKNKITAGVAMKEKEW